MKTFRETFELAESRIRPLLTERGFDVTDRFVVNESGSMHVAGIVNYLERRCWFRPFRKRRSIRLSLAPYRLELDLSIGIGNECYDIRELHQLEGNGVFPERKHDLYKAMHEEEQLQSEFERLIGLLISCGRRFFNGDKSLWIDLSKQSAARASVEQNQQVLKEADIAFKAGNWSEVVELLEARKQSLSKMNRARLNYAKKKMRDNT